VEDQTQLDVEIVGNLGTIYWVVKEIKLKNRYEYKTYNFGGIMFTLIFTYLFYVQKKLKVRRKKSSSGANANMVN
jgi:hypothetical protein